MSKLRKMNKRELRAAKILGAKYVRIEDGKIYYGSEPPDPRGYSGYGYYTPFENNWDISTLEFIDPIDLGGIEEFPGCCGIEAVASFDDFFGALPKVRGRRIPVDQALELITLTQDGDSRGALLAAVTDTQKGAKAALDRSKAKKLFSTKSNHGNYKIHCYLLKGEAK
jgi:hypothetical protein